jgi:hypothetical protein
MTASYPVRIERMYGAGIVRVAAKHNLREFAAEIGEDSHIDPARVKDNFVLRGPSTASDVACLAKSLMGAAGITKLRTNAVTALELLITLPARSAIDARRFFEDATRWVERHFGVPILSSVVHLDEAAPHCHVLLLPLVKGRMNGSDLHGGPAKLTAMQANFHKEVGTNYGLVRHEPKKRLSATEREAALACARQHFQTKYAMTEREINVLLKPHANDPVVLLRGLGIAIKPGHSESKSFVDIMIAPCKPDRRKPIGKAVHDSRGIVENGIPMDSFPYTCVGKGIETLSVSTNSDNHVTAAATSSSREQYELCNVAIFGSTRVHRINGCSDAASIATDSHPMNCAAQPASPTSHIGGTSTISNEKPTQSDKRESVVRGERARIYLLETRSSSARGAARTCLPFPHRKGRRRMPQPESRSTPVFTPPPAAPSKKHPAKIARKWLCALSAGQSIGTRLRRDT